MFRLTFHQKSFLQRAAQFYHGLILMILVGILTLLWRIYDDDEQQQPYLD